MVVITWLIQQHFGALQYDFHNGISASHLYKFQISYLSLQVYRLGG